MKSTPPAPAGLSGGKPPARKVTLADYLRRTSDVAAGLSVVAALLACALSYFVPKHSQGEDHHLAVAGLSVTAALLACVLSYVVVVKRRRSEADASVASEPTKLDRLMSGQAEITRRLDDIASELKRKSANVAATSRGGAVQRAGD